ncbi:hypothetical protein CJU90_1965 [Yarrowia sp. C11]|nr:hypothetical protein CJU90_1965 [Yarrowia sp. C11]
MQRVQLKIEYIYDTTTTFRSLVKDIPIAETAFPKWLSPKDMNTRTNYHMYLRACKRLDSVVEKVRREYKKSGETWPSCFLSEKHLGVADINLHIAMDLDRLKIPVGQKETFVRAGQRTLGFLPQRFSDDLIDRYKSGELDELDESEEECEGHGNDPDVDMMDVDGEGVDDVPPILSAGYQLRLLREANQQEVICREHVLASEEPVQTDVVVLFGDMTLNKPDSEETVRRLTYPEKGLIRE